MREITTLSDGSTIYYDTGDIDNWRVTYSSSNGSFTTSYKDATVFKYFNEIASGTSNQNVYQDLLNIHNQTEKAFDTAVVSNIKQIAQTYPAALRNKVERFFTLFYYMMVSEENKANTKTGKKIKMHGVHHLLINNRTHEDAAKIAYAYKGRADDLLRECEEMGF
ncbi:hypothetical protein F4694_005673 [Bacillus niacini]|uniref:Uncharacterized protein n=1 Tax=Neobacillus niacini TaxID=86668 RepID=A0A852TMW1_9BACI|nr:hypothetical protein [Neobacillus niacini]NYE08817.1 hypothetical protein [Neobacillus niacini]